MARMNDRGQILLIGALTIAITFVALGIVLNGSLHTPSMAAQATEDVTDNDLQRIHDTIERETVGAMERSNDNAVDPPDYITTRIYDTLGNRLQAYYARSDVVVVFENVEPISGRNVSTAVEDTNNIEDGYDDTEFRHFFVNPSASTGTEAIEVNLTTSGDTTYTMNISDGELELTNGPSDVIGDDCDYSSQIHIAEHQTDDGFCPALDFVDNLGNEYDINIKSVNGGSANYQLFYRDSSGSKIYKTDITYYVGTTDTTFEGTLEVAPGEP